MHQAQVGAEQPACFDRECAPAQAENHHTVPDGVDLQVQASERQGISI